MTNDEIVEMKSERPMTWSLMAEFLDELRADTFEFQGGQYLSATAEEMCNGLSLMRDKITAVLARVETEKAPPKPHKCAHSDLLLRLMVIARAGLESCGHCHKLVQIADEHRAFLLRDDVDRSSCKHASATLAAPCAGPGEEWELVDESTVNQEWRSQDGGFVAVPAEIGDIVRVYRKKALLCELDGEGGGR